MGRREPLRLAADGHPDYGGLPALGARRARHHLSAVTDRGRETIDANRTAIGPNDCLRCGSPLKSAGVDEFRVGGTSGGWKLFFGEWAELGEGMLKLEVLYCETCAKVELRLPTS